MEHEVKSEPLELLVSDAVDGLFSSVYFKKQEIEVKPFSSINQLDHANFEMKDDIKYEPSPELFDSTDFHSTIADSENNIIMNDVDSLLKNPFSLLTHEEKLKIKRLGAYQPRNVQITQQDGKKLRTFCVTWFDKKSWLTISNSKNAIFCFFCLLFGGDNLWTRTGCKDLKHLSTLILKHECSKSHINNVVQFTMFEKVNIASAFDLGYPLSITKHNDLVDKNRRTLSRILDCLKFCGFNDLLLRGQDETKQSNNCGVFLEMVSYTATLDTVLSNHLKNSKVAQYTSKTIQNDLLDCMYQVYVEEIKQEIDKGDFASVQVVEITDVTCRSQFIIILRYVKDFQPVERLLTFVNVRDRSASGLTNVLKDELQPFNLNNKLVAQTYDISAIMHDSQNEVQVQMREFYSHAHYVYFCSHQLNLILNKVCSSNKSIKIFFAALSGFDVFFTSSSKHNSLLQKVCHADFPKVCKTQWNFHSTIVKCVKENRYVLLECLNRIQSEVDWDDKSVCEAVGLQRSLEDDEFNFFLSFFYVTLQHLEVLLNVFQLSKSICATTKQAMTNFVSSINQIRDFVKNFIPKSATVDDDVILTNDVKRKKREVSNENICTLEIYAKETCTQMINEMKDRFRNLELFNSFVVVDPQQFKLHKQHFPSNHIHTIINNYSMLNKEKLISELSVMYENENFSDIPKINALSQFLSENQLLDTFSELSKLLEIVLVTPVSTADVECCFNTLQRIKTLLRNSVTQDRFTVLAVLSIHKDYISKIHQFNQKVIERFAQKSRREYLYK